MSFVSQTPVRERLWSAGGAAVIVALVGVGLVSGLRVSPFTRVQQALALVDIATPPPPPRPRPETKVVPKIAERAKGKPSPPNLRNRATPIVAPPPPPVTVPPPVMTAPAPNIGMAAQTGASDRAGPGQGAGGEGSGYGGGGDGGDGDDVPPRQTRGRLSFADLPANLRQGFSGGTVGVRYSVETDGRVGQCLVTHSSGRAELDRLTCQLIQQRFRFKPSRDGEDGAPVRSWIVENHSWDIDRDGYDQPPR
jgi:protein TonB